MNTRKLKLPQPDLNGTDGAGNPATPLSSSRGWIIAVVVFAAGLFLNFTHVTDNLDTGYLAGHEFRQSQTALSILFIQRDHDYSLAYPTPVFGPPWSIPMEFPLYQWAVAKVATQRGTSIEWTGRVVSALCFYLALPGVFILLRQVGATRQIALLGLTLILTAPIYIFYSRAILIESMALALSVWFLVAFVWLKRRGSWVAVLLTAVFGALASLVKITTFMVWGGVALVIGTAEIIRLFRSGERPAAYALATKAGLAGLVPLVSATAWIRYSDAIKADSPGGFFLTSENLSGLNLGRWSDRLNPDFWQSVTHHLTVGLLPGLGVLIVAVAWVWPGIGTRSKAALGLFGVTIATWLTFPHLYHIHDYYLYAVGVMPLAACALAVQRFSLSIKTGWVPFAVTVALAGLQWHSYHRAYQPLQSVVSNGGTTMHHFLRDATRPDEIIVVAGNDWSADVAYYMKRRVVLLKTSVHNEPAVIERVLKSLEGLPVAGLLVLGNTHGMDSTLATVIEALDLETAPTVRDDRNGFHARHDLAARIALHLQHYDNYGGVESMKDFKMEPQTDPIIADSTPHPATSNHQKSVFHLVSPSPSRYQAEYGLAIIPLASGVVMGAHADADFWVPWSDHTANFRVEFGLVPYAEADEQHHSDGVWFRVWGVAVDQAEALVWERWIDPWNQESDRGLLSETFSAASADFTEFRFEVRSGPSKAYDSAYWGRINIQP